ncbi:hypothetical protein [Flavobacterium inviolabile]|uniref:hypothetical protein n=1 Tax=Flavobacterium inviolabile TaxID=2748320 RepID=UPI0015B20096|nr:hypothetical protein [Flavobacterium inviolabile]
MKSSSESGFGARAANAEKLVTALQYFDNYQPQKPGQGFAAFSALLLIVKEKNRMVAEKRQNYSLAVENRKQLFTSGENAIRKLLSPIRATIRASFGKTSKQAHDINSIIAKIRGTNKTYNVDRSSIENNVSLSYRSFGSQAQFFSDLIVNLENFGAAYTPSNSNLSITALKNLLAEATEANNLLMAVYTELRQANRNRITAHAELSATAQGIKDSVKAQYGTQKSEYRLIKGFKI